MPTKKQLHARWRSEFKLQQINPQDKNSESFTGKVIGTIEYNPTKKELKITPKK